MAILKTPSTARAMTEREQEVQRAEQEVATLEGRQAAEMSRLEASAAEVQTKLEQLKALASRAGLDEAADPENAGLRRRLEETSVAPAGFDEHRDQMLAVRLEATRARMKVGERVSQAISAYKATLSQLMEQLAADEQLLRKHQARRDEVAARRAREAKQREAEAKQQQAEARQREVEAKQQRQAGEPARQPRTELDMPAVEAPPPSGPAPSPSRPPRQAPASTRQAPASSPQASAPTSPGLEPRSARVRMQASINLHSESNFFQGFSTNLSEGGLFVATIQMLPRGTPVDLHFTLPGGRKIAARGVVRWTREANDRTPDIFPGVGVQFVDLPNDAATAIRDFVAEREPLFFPD